LQSAKADPQSFSDMTICGHEKKGAKENSSGTADGLTTNSVTVAEHMNLNTVLFSPPVDGALYPLLPTCRDSPTHSAMKSGDNLNISTFEARR